MKLKLPAVLFAMLVLLPTESHAEERAMFLQKVYMSFCLKHFDDYGALRQGLIEQRLPKLPPEQAAHFLQGQEGDAWPVPYGGQFGQFVLTLPAGDNLCAVMARRADAAATERWFTTLAGEAPAPLQVEQIRDERLHTALSGMARTRAWRWAAVTAPQQLLLTLTTATDPKAAIQTMVSLTLVNTDQREP